MRPAIVAAIVLLTMASRVCAVGYVDGWGIFTDPLPDQSTWAAYYGEHARVQLGPERRLPNGIAWRLHTDAVTGIAFPRVTWMPDSESVRTVNRLLEMGHGGALLDSAANERRLAAINAFRKKKGWPPLSFEHAIEQMDVDLAYASARLASIIDLELVRNEGNHETKIIRGLTFDLKHDSIHRVTACPGSNIPYGFAKDLESGNFLFQFGDLLRVCDAESYRGFVRLLQAHAEQGARTSANSKDPYVTQCIHHYAGDRKDIGENQEIVLYLAFAGLAVFNTGFFPESDDIMCASKRTSLNPVIIPYAELKPFMIPGPWRDELLALPATRR